MAAKNRAIKTLMILVNVLVWGFVIIRIWPLIFSGTDTPVPRRRAIRPVGNSRPPVRRVDVPPAAIKDLPRGAIVSNLPWMGSDLIPFFASIFDPFRPVLAPARKGAGVRVARVHRKRVRFDTPRGVTVRRKPVVTIYRLSGIVRISGKTSALLTTGLGSQAATITARQGMRLPGGDYVRKIDFRNKNVILVKKGHVFKLVDYSPWVILISKP